MVKVKRSVQAHERPTGLKKDRWTAEEKEKLRTFMQENGHDQKRRGFWPKVPKLAGLKRCWKSCWERWKQHERNGIKKGNFTQEEDNAIISLRVHLGNKWAAIASKLPDRTANDIKNHWNQRLKKQQQQQQPVPQPLTAADTHELRRPNPTRQPQLHGPTSSYLAAAAMEDSTVNNCPDQFGPDHLIPIISDPQLVNTINNYAVDVDSPPMVSASIIPGSTEETANHSNTDLSRTTLEAPGLINSYGFDFNSSTDPAQRHPVEDNEVKLVEEIANPSAGVQACLDLEWRADKARELTGRTDNDIKSRLKTQQQLPVAAAYSTHELVPNPLLEGFVYGYYTPNFTWQPQLHLHEPSFSYPAAAATEDLIVNNCLDQFGPDSLIPIISDPQLVNNINNYAVDEGSLLGGPLFRSMISVSPDERFSILRMENKIIPSTEEMAIYDRLHGLGSNSSTDFAPTTQQAPDGLNSYGFDFNSSTDPAQTPPGIPSPLGAGLNSYGFDFNSSEDPTDQSLPGMAAGLNSYGFDFNSSADPTDQTLPGMAAGLNSYGFYFNSSTDPADQTLPGIPSPLAAGLNSSIDPAQTLSGIPSSLTPGLNDDWLFSIQVQTCSDSTQFSQPSSQLGQPSTGRGEQGHAS